MLNVDENTRTVSGYGTVEIVDNQGDYVPIDVVLRLMDTYMNRGGVLVDTHTNRHVGKILHWEPKEKDGKNAVWLQAQIFDDYSIDDMIWDAIKEGHYTGFSFGGRGLDKHVVCNAEQGCFNHIDDMEIWEWSIVPKPANKESTIDEFNKLAKGDKLTDAMMPVLNSKGNIEYMEVELLQKAEKESPEEEKAYLEEDVDLAEGEEADCPLKEKEKAMGNREMNPDSDRPLQYYRDAKHSERVKPDRRNRRKLSSTEIKDARNVAEASNDPKQNIGKDDIPEYMMHDGHGESSKATKRAIRYANKGEQNMTENEVEILVPMEKSDGTTSWEPMIIGEDALEKAGDEIPVTPPAEESDSPMNQILKKLEGIESRITKLEGTSGQPEIESGETEKAETPKKVTLPEAEQTNDTTHITDDKQIEHGKAKQTPSLNKSEELASIVQNELQKAGYTETPRPAAQSDQPFMDNGALTIKDVLMKSDEGGFDMHKALANKSFDDLNTLFGGE
jgi:hypothetical protein